jgi:hypothetical protein
VSSGPSLLQGAEDQFRRLCAGDTVRAVEHEEGDSGDSQLARLQLVVTNVLGIRVAVEHRASAGLVEPDLDREPRQDVGLADRRSLNEVGGQQTLLERVLLAVRMRVVDQAVGVERVAGPGPVEVEVQPLGRGVGRDPRLRGLRGGAAHAVFGGEALHRITLRRGWRARIELEAAPGDRDLLAMIEGGQGVLETALADVAPGTDDVGPDLDIHGSVVPDHPPVTRPRPDSEFPAAGTTSARNPRADRTDGRP